MSQNKKDKFEKDHKLNTIWTLWYHNPNNNNWGLDSYRDIIFFNTIEEFWNIYKYPIKDTTDTSDTSSEQNEILLNMDSNYITPNLIQNGMFFMMREYIRPIWEDDQNCMGGCRSYKVDKKDVYRVWVELSARIIGMNIVEDEHWDMINGISISPKKTFSIIKIWINKHSLRDVELNLDNIYILGEEEEGIYRAHVSNIEKHKTRMKQINARKNQFKNNQFKNNQFKNNQFKNNQYKNNQYKNNQFKNKF